MFNKFFDCFKKSSTCQIAAKEMDANDPELSHLVGVKEHVVIIRKFQKNTHFTPGELASHPGTIFSMLKNNNSEQTVHPIFTERLKKSR